MYMTVYMLVAMYKVMRQDDHPIDVTQCFNYQERPVNHSFTMLRPVPDKV